MAAFRGPSCLKTNQLLSGIWEILGNSSQTANITCPTAGSIGTALSAGGHKNSSSSFNAGSPDANILDRGLDLYAYVTPFVIVSGIIGNIISLRVFLSRRMRKMSASLYLACLAVSDACVLLTYVLFEWLQRGLPRWPGGRAYDLIAVPGMCQAYVFASYIFRFMSAWFIVAFTIERCVGILMPIKRRTLCKRTFARRSLGVVIASAFAISLYKPILSTVYKAPNGTLICSWKPPFRLETFVLDSVYGSTITVIPFVIMLTLNLLICRKLRQTKQRHLRNGILTRESSIKLEFTAILLVVSSAFIVLNVPYFVTWCCNLVSDLHQMTRSIGDAHSEIETTRGWKYITKTIFYGNYCVNFFIYSLSGAYFRFQLRRQVPCMASRYGRDPSDRARNRVTLSHSSAPMTSKWSALTNRNRGGGAGGVGGGAEIPRTHKFVTQNGLFIVNK